MKQHLVSTCALLLVACGGSALDVGSSKGGSSGEEGGRTSEEGGTSAGGRSFGGAAVLGGRAATGGVETASGAPAMGARAGTSGGEVNGASGKPTGEAAAPGMGTGGIVATGGATMVGGTGGTAGVPGAPPNLLVPQTCSQKSNQVWEGNTLDFFFNPQNEKWRLEFDGTDANGRVCGTATYIAAGEAPPPPATSADETYPPGYNAALNFMKPAGAWPGVTYSIIQGATVGTALHFRISPTELWQGWCALQTPVPSSNGYGCIDTSNGWGSDGTTCTVTHSDGTTDKYSQAKCLLCGVGTCTCNADSCAAADSGQPVVFDLTVNGEQMTGTVDGKMVRFDLVK